MKIETRTSNKIHLYEGKTMALVKDNQNKTQRKLNVETHDTIFFYKGNRIPR